MKKCKYLMILGIMAINCISVFAQENNAIISLYQGSKLIFDDNIGFETHYYLTSETSQKAIDGKMNRKFCSAPQDVSPYEIIKNYEKAILSKGGSIIHISREASSYIDKNTGKKIKFMEDYFAHGRVNDRLLSNSELWAYANLPSEAEDYVVGKISTPEHDIFISVAAAVFSNVTYYTIVTVLAEPMDMDNVTLNVLNEGIAKSGRVAIYDIYFDTGKSEVKNESNTALAIIADYLKENSDKKFLIVGHTDNTGNFESNIQLSTARAKAVLEKLISDYGINSSQLKPYGVGSASPQISNATKEGRARNRRVELVEF